MAAKNKFMNVGRGATILIFLLGLGAQSAAAQKPASRATATKQPTGKHLEAPRTLHRRIVDARPLRVFYYFDDVRGYASLQTHAAGISVLAPQCFSVDEAGFIHGAIPARAMEASRAGRFALMPLLFNPGFNRGTVTALLRSAKAQERAAHYMAYLAKRDNALGFQIDLEHIDPADRRLFTQFVRRAAAKLHSEGRLLSVAVTPRFSDRTPGPRHENSTATGEWSAAYDYRALGRYADFVTLMTYDHSTRSGPPGPIAGYAWVKTALDYAVSRIPRTKLLLGIPLYGREWTDAEGITDSRSVTAQDVRELIERPEIQVRWNDKWRSPWFEYRDGDALHTVWYEDARSLREKLDLMREYHLRGFAAWRLGDEGPEFWPLTAEAKAAPTRAQVHPSRSATPVRRRSKSPKAGKLSTEVRTRAPHNGR